MRPWMKEIVQHIKVNNVENVIVNKEGRILKVWFGVICMNKWGKLVRETEHYLMRRGFEIIVIITSLQCQC